MIDDLLLPAAWWDAWRETEWPVWLGIAAIALPYAWGVRRMWRAAGRGRGITTRKAGWFVAGIVMLIIALASPLDQMAEALFSAHMVQHLLLIAVIPPLLIMGSPEIGYAWAMPRLVQRISGHDGTTPTPHAWPRRTWLIATTPWLIWACHAAVVWVWHLPRLYRVTLNVPMVHGVEHVMFFGTAVLLWWAAMRPRGIRRNGYGVAVLLMLATAMQSGALGALLASSRNVWYAEQARRTLALHLNPLTDQQLAGLIMWVPGGLVYTLAGCIFFLAWLGQRNPARPELESSRVGVGASA